jgi:hypothetical protein
MCAVLLNCTQTAEQRPALLKLYLKEIGTEIHDKLQKTDFRSLKWLLKEVQRCIKVFYNHGGAFLEPAELSAIYDMSLNVCTTVKQDKELRQDQLSQARKKMDEEDIEAIEENIEKMDHVWSYTMEISGVLIRNMPELASAEVMTKLLPLYAKMLMNVESQREYELIDGLCMLDDCIEHGNEALLAQVLPQAGAKFLEVIKTRGKESENLCQNCVFGLGVLAQRTPAGQFALLGDSLQAINFVLTETLQGKVDSNCHDNAIGALGKFIYFQRAGNEGVLTAKIVEEQFLSRLPLVVDSEEAQAVHLELVQQVQAKNPALVECQQAVKDALTRIQLKDQEQPGLEILSDAGKAALASTMSQI